MNILPGPKGMPTLLLARVDKYDADGSLADAEEGRRVGDVEESRADHEPAALRG
jgi:hypothetical protein